MDTLPINTTMNTNNGSDADQYAMGNSTVPSPLPMMSQVAYYCNYLFITLGTLSNIVAVVLLYRFNSAREKNNTVRYYLIVVAASDGMFVFWMSLLLICNGLDEPVHLFWDTGCSITFFAIFCSSQLSSLMIMMVTINRYIAIYHPLKFKALQSIKKIYSSIAGCTLAVVAVNWYGFGGLKRISREELETIEYFEYECRGRTTGIDEYYFMIYPWFDLALYLVVPGIVLLVLNIAIAAKLRQFGKVAPIGTNTQHRDITCIEIIPFEAISNTMETQAEYIDTFACGAVCPNSSRNQISKEPSDVLDNENPAAKSQPNPSAASALESNTFVGSSGVTNTFHGSTVPTKTVNSSLAPIEIHVSPGPSKSTKTLKGLSIPTEKSTSTTAFSCLSAPANTFDHSSLPMETFDGPITSTKPFPSSLPATTERIAWSSEQHHPAVPEDARGAQRRSPTPGSNLVRRGQHMTRICIALSVSFLLLAFPMTVVRLAILTGLLDPGSPVVQTVYQMVTLLVMGNHVMNFWIYCACWKEFREQALDFVTLKYFRRPQRDR